MAISPISRNVINESIQDINKEIAALDRRLGPLILQRTKLDEQILAIQGRKTDLIDNASKLNEDVRT